jgi:hypothetical protein
LPGGEGLIVWIASKTAAVYIGETPGTNDAFVITLQSILAAGGKDQTKKNEGVDFCHNKRFMLPSLYFSYYEKFARIVLTNILYDYSDSKAFFTIDLLKKYCCRV